MMSKQKIVSKSSKPLAAWTGLLLAGVPLLGNAHVGHVHDTPMSWLGSLQAGLLHPVTGLDHLVLAVGMGMLLYALHKSKLGLLALAAGLTSGFTLGVSGMLAGVGDNFIEGGILLSVLLVTLALMSRHLSKSNKASIKSLALAGFGALAVFHGAAHGLEVPSMANAYVFFAGMMLSMLLLFAVGTVLMQQLKAHSNDSILAQRVLAILGVGAVWLG